MWRVSAHLLHGGSRRLPLTSILQPGRLWGVGTIPGSPGVTVPRGWGSGGSGGAGTKLLVW